MTLMIVVDPTGGDNVDTRAVLESIEGDASSRDARQYHTPVAMKARVCELLKVPVTSKYVDVLPLEDFVKAWNDSDEDRVDGRVNVLNTFITFVDV